MSSSSPSPGNGVDGGDGGTGGRAAAPGERSYGSWPSILPASALAAGAIRLTSIATAEGIVVWGEGRPSEGGRTAVVARTSGGASRDVLDAPWSARTSVHEYGGGSFATDGHWLWFCSFADQRVWRVGLAGGEPAPLTEDPPISGSWRYADLTITADGQHIVCVRERHGAAVATEPVNDLVRIPADGGPPVVVGSGHDFYSSPRLSPDGRRLAYLTWDHPNMPWDGTDLWEVELDPDSGALGERRHVAGGTDESITEPRYSPDGRLHFISDRRGWWNLYAAPDSSVVVTDNDIGGPEWTFGSSSYTWVDGELVTRWHEGGSARLVAVTRTGEVRTIGLDRAVARLDSLQPSGGHKFVAIAGGATWPASVVEIDVGSGHVEVVRTSADALPDEWVSPAQPIEFATSGGETAHAFFYAPRNPSVTPPAGERPPLVVLSHGGPTGQASPVYSPPIQYWTTRGIAVVDVDYRGSSGYGRAYRRRLDGEWGVLDVDDCVAAARALSEQGRVDGERMVIRGRSAGGFTALAALAFRPGVFAAGASLYGIGDLEILARDTHKFESRYLDRLVAPWPEGRAVYEARSPIHHTDRLAAPLMIFQGLDDKVVPPSQAEAIAAALDAKKIPYAYMAFAGEQHGFRQADTLVRVAEAELWFYGKVLGFEPAGDIEPVSLAHADRL